MAAKENLEAQRNNHKGGSHSRSSSAGSLDSQRRNRTMTRGGGNTGSSISLGGGSSGSRKNLSRTSSTASNPGAARALGKSSSDSAGTQASPAAIAGAAMAVDANSRVASLQRQLEALTTRQEESEVTLPKAGLHENGHEPGNLRSGRGGGGAGAGTSRLEATTRRCAELEDKVDDLEGECEG